MRSNKKLKTFSIEQDRMIELNNRIDYLSNRISEIENLVSRNVEIANYNKKQDDKIIAKIVKKLFGIKRVTEYVDSIPN